jgi:hypothetical protein
LNIFTFMVTVCSGHLFTEVCNLCFASCVATRCISLFLITLWLIQLGENKEPTNHSTNHSIKYLIKSYKSFGITNYNSKTYSLSLVTRLSTLYSSHRQGLLCPMTLRNAYESWKVIKTINHVAILVNLYCPKPHVMHRINFPSLSVYLIIPRSRDL